MGNCRKVVAQGTFGAPSLQLPALASRAEVPAQDNIKRYIMRRMIWAEDERLTGWCCSDCPWGLTAPRLESTVAALAFNRLAQETFEKHNCADSTHQDR